jgi:GAF domain-containing protein/ANTAR domain-containing protein
MSFAGDQDKPIDDFVEVARELQSAATTQATLDTVCRLAVDVIDGAEHAAITVVRDGDFSTVAASSDIPRVIDRIQYETGEGPCLDCIREHDAFITDDLTQEQRWPAFTNRVVSATGVRSMQAHRLFLQENTLGALNLYAVPVAAFTDTSRALGAMFAAHAAVAYQAAKDHDKALNLELALQSNRRIGMAMGIVMSQQSCTEHDAFSALRTVSQQQHRKLLKIAEEVILSGTLDT